MSSPAYDREYARAWRRSNPEAYRAYQEQYRAENVERIREIRRESARRRRAELRALEEPMSRPTICHSCRARFKFGHPAASDNWRKIDMSPTTFRALQQAATEFDQLSEEAGEYQTAQEFLDWLAPSIPGTEQHEAREKRPDTEGVAVVVGGNTKGNGHTRITTTDPLPFAPLRRLVG
jgi:hypothetical protein